MTAAALYSAIPSPSSGELRIGPLDLRAYGLMIALGVVAAVWLFGRRLEAAGIGTRDDAAGIALWGVPAGVIGARLYHVATDWELFEDHPENIVKIWKGGLGIPGGMALGIAVGVWAAWRRGLPLGPTLNAVAPALPLAQAVGRWGNWFNQELFGRPTDLPWALKVDADTAIDAGYPAGTTFHPTFLYESLWNLALCGLIILIGRRVRVRPGRLLAVYVLGYGIGRFWVEGLRIDHAKESGGLRLNQWMSIVLVAGSAGFLLVDWLRHRHDPPPADPEALVGTDDGGTGAPEDIGDPDARKDEGTGDDEAGDGERAGDDERAGDHETAGGDETDATRPGTAGAESGGGH